MRREVPYRARRWQTWSTRLLAGLWALVAMACEPPDEAPPERLEVLAASSLTEAMRALAERFEAQRPDVRVSLSFAGSQALRMQLEQGAPADVFASASEPHMAALHTAGLVEPPTVFAHNRMVVVLSDGAPPLQRFVDLPQAERIVLGSPQVPAGAYADAILQRAAAVHGRAFAAAVMAHVVSREPNVRLVRAKVELGEADAALVYQTDAAEGGLRTVAIPEALGVIARYPIAAVAASKRLRLARAFIAFARGKDGQRLLRTYGFLGARP